MSSRHPAGWSALPQGEPDDTSLVLPLAVYCLFKCLVNSNGIESPGRQPYNKSTISQILVELLVVSAPELPYHSDIHHDSKRQPYYLGIDGKGEKKGEKSRQISDVVASVCSSTQDNGLANGDEMQFEQTIPLCSQKSPQRPHSLHERLPVHYYTGSTNVGCTPFTAPVSKALFTSDSGSSSPESEQCIVNHIKKTEDNNLYRCCTEM